ncbi:hypothetical protein [Bacillus atrophaeus]|uniref:hypothetical protein n=1 Tax=Bacillus atrophaeus TaxID=1452 RepID=UPI00227E3490|nr:hypothetical protein [Bacillus atrophaeus]MCY8513831.1 hypothetical protein [Bacillus atrophaeus]MCY8990675.1 hypothetical protein [Bacillus atrophaeus]
MSGVIRLDNLAAVYGGAHIHSVKAKLNVENGHVGVVGTPYEGERELRLFKRATDPSKEKAALVAQDEIMYDQTRRSQNNLKNFKIEAGQIFRVYDLVEGDIFSVSPDLIDALGDNVIIGNKVILQANSFKYKEVAEADVTDQRFVGRIEAIEKVGAQTVIGKPGYVGGFLDLVVIRVEQN